MSPLARAIVRRTVLVLLATLLGVGVLTAVAQHLLATRLMDQALEAAALGHGHAVETEWRNHHVASVIEVFPVDPGDARVPDALARRVLREEQSAFFTDGPYRVAVVVVERDATDDAPDPWGEVADRRHERGEEHRLVAATALAPTWIGSLAGFLPIYGGVALLAGLTAALGIAQVVRGSFTPLERARHEAARVGRLGTGQRLTEEGPEEVRALLAALNGVLDRLDAAHLAQSRFTAEAAHELRTPITAMLGELDVALRRERDADFYRQTLTSTREEVERLHQIVEGLLTLARLDAGQSDAPTPVAAAEGVATVLQHEGPAVLAAGGRLESAVDPDLVLTTHAPWIQLALGNLVRNAARHAPGSAVHVSATRHGDQVCFAVDDDGPGLGEGPYEPLFDRFVRGPAARRDDRAGLGLGLPMVREIATRLGGTCRLGPSARGGARAELWVPVG